MKHNYDCLKNSFYSLTRNFFLTKNEMLSTELSKKIFQKKLFRKFILKFWIGILLTVFCTSKMYAQFSIAATGTNYTQDFNTLTSGTWTDNSTLIGWYAKTDATATITSYGANTGSTTTAGLYAYGIAGTNPLSDRSLGYATSNAFTGSAPAKNYIGWRLKNNSGISVNSITVIWTGEQWRRDNSTSHVLTLTYQVAATVTNLTAGSWVSSTSTFTSPQIVGAASLLDGNASPNRVANISLTISVSIPAGQEIMLRWEDPNDSGNDHHLTIDDVSVSVCNQFQFFVDADLDTYGGSTTSMVCATNASSPPSGYSLTNTDCNDNSASINPGATEITGDGIDQDCNGNDRCFCDSDHDGYRPTGSSCTSLSSNLQCLTVNGQASLSTPDNDCNDGNAAINPGAVEVCDASNTDEDCDGLVNDADPNLNAASATTWYRDIDADGYGSSSDAGIVACVNPQPGGRVSNNSDCNDTENTINPAATEVTGDGIDQDCDGHDLCFCDFDDDTYITTVPGCTRISVDATCSGTHEAVSTDPPGDCDDGDAAIHPTASEVCDAGNTDEDCDGLVNDADPSMDPLTSTRWYVDADGDGFGSSSDAGVLSCANPSTPTVVRVLSSTDCNDAASSVHPGATEIVGDGVDQDCDGNDRCYCDSDGDNFTSTNLTCTVSASGLSCPPKPGGDCDDTDNQIFPRTFHIDSDLDSYGSPGTQIVCSSATPPSGSSTNSGDCNDGNSNIHPGANEVCNGTDDDCDVAVDDNAIDASLWYVDTDADGHGAASDPGTLSCTAPTGTVASNDDCDDGDDDIHPGASEVCNGADDDCDGAVDDNAVDASLWYVDADADGFGSSSDAGVLSCNNPSTPSVVRVLSNTDCNDASSAIHPGATEITGDDVDQDCDGHDRCYCDNDADNFTSTNPACTIISSGLSCPPKPGGDCDDGNDDIFPGAAEVCNGTDDDCDGAVDNNSVDATLWYVDADVDGHGAAGSTAVSSCIAPVGRVASSDDCDDSDPAIHPGATEITGDDVDQDCDGHDRCFCDSDNDGFVTTTPGCTTTSSGLTCTGSGEANSSVPGGDCDDGDDTRFPRLVYPDNDDDGYGTGAGQTICTTAPVSGSHSSLTGGDCDDTNNSIHPFAAEVCDSGGGDEDCDGLVNDSDPSMTGGTLWYTDGDGDGHGAAGSTAVSSCTAPGGRVASSDDCDDSDPSIHPGASEICDAGNVDEDCDGVSNDNDPDLVATTLYYLDNDGDGFGLSSSGVPSCVQPSNRISVGGDCDDSDDTSYPGATEVCDGHDNDCDGTVDDGIATTTLYRTVSSLSSGVWSDPSTWEFSSCGSPYVPAVSPPDAGDDVRVETGFSVLLGGTSECNNLHVDGTLDLGGHDLRIKQTITINHPMVTTGSHLYLDGSGPSSVTWTVPLDLYDVTITSPSSSWSGTLSLTTNNIVISPSVSVTISAPSMTCGNITAQLGSSCYLTCSSGYCRSLSVSSASLLDLSAVSVMTVDGDYSNSGTVHTSPLTIFTCTAGTCSLSGMMTGASSFQQLHLDGSSSPVTPVVTITDPVSVLSHSFMTKLRSVISSSMTVGGDFTVTPTATFDGASSSLTFTAGPHLWLDGSPAGVSKYGYVITLSVSVTTLSGSSIYVYGGIQCDGSLDASTSEVTMKGTSPGYLSGTGSNVLVFKKLTIDKPSSVVTCNISDWSVGDWVIDNGTMQCGSSVIHVTSSLINNCAASCFDAQSSRLVMDGSTTCTVGGTSPLSLHHLSMSLSGGSDMQMTNDVSLDGNLDFVTSTAGHIVTGSNVLYMSSPASTVSGAGAHTYVAGNLKKRSELIMEFETGDVPTQEAYTPLELSFSSITTPGDITVSSTLSSTHPSLATSGLDLSNTAAHRWHIDATGPLLFTDCDVTLTYGPNDIPATADPLSFVVSSFDNNTNTWSSPPVLSATTNEIQCHTTHFSDFLAGESSCTTPTATFSTTSVSSCSSTADVIVDLTGDAPWDLVIDDGTGVFQSFTGIPSTPYTATVTSSSAGTLTLSLYSVENACGNGMVDVGQATATFNSPATGILNSTPITTCTGDADLHVDFTGTPPYQVRINEINGQYPPINHVGIPSSSYTIPVTGLAPGTYTFTLSLTTSQHCGTGTSSGSVTVTSNPASTLYRSSGSGSWFDPSNWEVSTCGSSYTAASSPPSSTDNVEISAGDVIDIDAALSRAIGTVTIVKGALHMSSGYYTLSLASSLSVDAGGDFSMTNGELQCTGCVVTSSNSAMTLYDVTVTSSSTGTLTLSSAPLLSSLSMHNVTLASGATCQMTCNDGYCSSITTSGGSSLDISSLSVMTCSGDYSNGGSVSTSALTKFTCSDGDCSLSGSMTAGSSFHNVEMDGPTSPGGGMPVVKLINPIAMDKLTLTSAQCECISSAPVSMQNELSVSSSSRLLCPSSVISVTGGSFTLDDQSSLSLPSEYGTLYVSPSTSLSLGSSKLVMFGGLDNHGSISPGTSRFLFSGATSVISSPTSLLLYDVTISGFTALTMVTGELSLHDLSNDGSLDASSLSKLSISGDYLCGSTSHLLAAPLTMMTCTAGTCSMSGPMTGSNSFDDLTIAAALGAVVQTNDLLELTGTLKMEGGRHTPFHNMVVGGDVQIDPNGTLAPQADITCKGSWKNHGAYVSAVSSSVTMSCPAGNCVMEGSMTGSNSFSSLTISPPLSVSILLSADLTCTSTLSVSSGTLDLNSRTCKCPLGYYVSSSGRTIGGSLSFPSLSSVSTWSDLSSVGSVYDDISIESGATVDMTTSAFSVTGDWTCDGVMMPGTSEVTFNGPNNSMLSGTGTVEFAKVIVDRESGRSKGFGCDAIMADVTFTQGYFVTNSHTLYITSDVHGGSSSSFVEGRVHMSHRASVSSRSYPVGTEAGTATPHYSPVTLSFSSITSPGGMTVSATEALHSSFAGSGLSLSNRLSTNWTVDRDPPLLFTTCDVTLTYDPSMATGNPSLYRVAQFDAPSTWTPVTAAIVAPAMLTFTTTNFSDFLVGEDDCTITCQNGGIADLNSCTCTCPVGFTGQFCENAVCTTPVFSASSSNPTCSSDDGSITLTPNGSYTYNWITNVSCVSDVTCNFGGGPNSTCNITSNTCQSTNQDLSNLPAGTYTVTVSNGPGCTATASYTLTAPASTTYYEDSDGDTYGNPAVTLPSCTGAPSGYVSDATDCDDQDPAINPGATEIADNGIDEDCNGSDLITGCSDPVFVDAGPDISTCTDGTVILNGLIYGGASTGTWSASSGTFSDVNDLNAEYTPDPLQAGNVITITLTSDDPAGACPAVTDNFLLTINQSYVVNAGPDQTACENSFFQLAGTLTSGATQAEWTGGSGTFSPDRFDLNAIYTPAPSEAGTTVTLTLVPVTDPMNVCPVVTDEVLLDVDPLPVVNAGTDASVCEGSPFTLQGTVNNGAGTGHWTGGVGTFSDANDLNSTYTPDVSETNTYVEIHLTSDNGLNTCDPVTDIMMLYVTDLYVDAGADIHVCGDGGSVLLSPLMSGGPGTGTWTGGAGTFSPNATTPNATYTPDPSETGTDVTLTFTTDPGAGCGSASDDIVITVDDYPTVNAGPDINSCVESSVILSGIVFGSGVTNGHWTGGLGTFSDIYDLNAEYTPDPSEVNTIVELILVSDNAPNACTSAYDTVLITIDPRPIANPGSDAFICYEGTVLLNGSVTDGTGTGTWQTSGDGTFDDASNLNAEYTPGASDLLTGAVTLTLTPDPTGFCAVQSDDIEITINPQIVITPTVTDATCYGAADGSISVSVSGGTGPYDYDWSNGPVTPLNSGLIAGTYDIDITDAVGCPMFSSITVSQPDEIVVSSFAPSSGGSGTVVVISGSGFTGATNVLFNGTSASSFTVDSDNQITATAPASATTGFITVVNGSCSGVSTTVFTTNITLTVKLYIQGYYNPATHLMRAALYNGGDPATGPTDVDLVTIDLMNATTHLQEATFTGMIQTNGLLVCTFSGSVNGGNYYLRVTSRNLLESWSGSAVLITDGMTYDFTDDINKVYPDVNNTNPQMYEVEPNIWALYNGDVNQDNSIDGIDFNLTEIDNNDFAFGYTYPTDVTGEGSVDGLDFNLLEINVGLFLFVAQP
jgi:hypothetical protein